MPWTQYTTAHSLHRLQAFDKEQNPANERDVEEKQTSWSHWKEWQWMDQINLLVCQTKIFLWWFYTFPLSKANPYDRLTKPITILGKNPILTMEICSVNGFNAGGVSILFVGPVLPAGTLKAQTTKSLISHWEEASVCKQTNW